MRTRLLVVVGAVLLSAILAYLAFSQLSRPASAPPPQASPQVGSAAQPDGAGGAGKTPPAGVSPVTPEAPAAPTATVSAPPTPSPAKPKTRSPPPVAQAQVTSPGPPKGHSGPDGTSPAPPPEPGPKTRSISPPDAPAATTAIPAFPWPPPAPSAEHQIRNTWVTKGERTALSDVAQKLESALEDADYETWRYSSVPRGFALATQLEQIGPDGTPRSGKERFRTDLPSLADMTFVEFLKALAKAPPGYYRVIVFVVTNTPFSRSASTPTEQEAQRWLHVGLNQLPKSIGVMPYSDDYRTTALVYEFRKASKNSAATFVPKSPESGKIHLEKAGIWDALTR